MMKTTITPIVVLLCSMTANAAGLPKYKCELLSLPTQAAQISGWAMNNSGVVVGASPSGQTNVFIATKWESTAPQSLGNATPGSTAAAINDLGDAVGSTSEAGTSRPVLWQGNSEARLAMLPDCRYGSAMGINTAGDVIGYCEAGAQLVSRAVIWKKGQAVALRSLNDDPTLPNIALDINDAGVVVGRSYLTNPDSGEPQVRAVRWNPGLNTIDNLGVLPNGIFSVANALNSKGVIVGDSHYGDPFLNSHAAAWVDNTVNDMGALPGGTYSTANDVNDSGVAVGYSNDAAGHANAVIWSSVNASPVLLQSRIAAGCKSQLNAGFVLTGAESINNGGVVLVNAARVTSSGRTQHLAFRLIPR